MLDCKERHLIHKPKQGVVPCLTGNGHPALKMAGRKGVTKMATADFTKNVRQQLLERRYRLHTLHTKKVVLGQSVDPDATQPFAVYSLDASGQLYSKANYSSYQDAFCEFNARAYPHEHKVYPEQTVHFDHDFGTHRVGTLRGWLVVETCEGDCFAYKSARDLNDLLVQSDLGKLMTEHTYQYAAEKLADLVQQITG